MTRFRFWASAAIIRATLSTVEQLEPVDGRSIRAVQHGYDLGVEVFDQWLQAEFGHASGGIVNVISRSGSNTVHGLASVFLRDNVLDTSDIPVRRRTCCVGLRCRGRWRA